MIKDFIFQTGLYRCHLVIFYINDLRKLRHEFRNIHLQIQNKKWEFIKQENEVVNKNERLSVFYQIINGVPSLYTLNSKNPILLPVLSTKEHIEKKYW